jgi:hypothetical protein
VLDPLLHEAVASLDVAAALVQRERVRLGVKRDAVGSARACDAIGLREDGAGHASPALVGLYCQAAEPSHATAEEQSAGADHSPGFERDQMGGFGVAAVPIGLEGHTLLAAEDPLAQRKRGVELLLRLCLPDLQDQRA